MKDAVIRLIDKEIAEENECFAKHMELNPTDAQRVHDHEVTMAAFCRVLHGVKNMEYIPDEQGLSNMRNQLCERADREAAKLFRLAWRAQAHGCRPKTVEQIREEARELHMTGYPERLLDPFRKWKFAFRMEGRS